MWRQNRDEELGHRPITPTTLMVRGKADTPQLDSQHDSQRLRNFASSCVTVANNSRNAPIPARRFVPTLRAIQRPLDATVT